MRYYWHTELPLEAFKHVGDRRIKPQGGGTGIPIVDNALDAGSDLVGGVADAASDVVGGAVDIASDVVGGAADAVSDVSSAVVDTATSIIDGAVNVVEDVGDSVVKAVDTIIESAENDPLGFVVNVGLIATGNAWALPYFNAANAAAHGADIDQIAKTAALSYAAGQAGAAAGSELAGTGLEATGAGAAAGATSAALGGGDIVTGGLSGGINSGLNSALSSAVNAPTTSGGATSQTQEGDYKYTPDDSYEYKSTDNTPFKADYGAPTQNGLGLKATSIPTEIDFSSPISYGLSAAPQRGVDGGGLGLYASESPNINKMNGAQGLTLNDGKGTLSALGYTPLNASPNLGDPNSFINDPNVLGRDVAQTDTSLNLRLPKINFAGALGIGVPSGPTSSVRPIGTQQSEKYGSPSLLNGSDVTGDSTGDPFYLEKLRQLYGSLTPEMQNILQTNNDQKFVNQASSGQDQTMQMAVGGSTDSSKDTESVFPQAKTGVYSPFIAGGQRRIAQLAPLVQMQKGVTRMAHGGLPARHHPDAPKGHHPEFVTGETGYYAQGRGTGQSDDIPAMLRHGDYVVDADTVAALGDGSSKAGAEVLEGIRSKVPTNHAQGGSAAGSSIPAQIADGEYVFPAAFVTALGSGDNARGAKILDGMRQKIREHKRSAPSSKIPPKAKSPLEYIKMASKGK